MTDTLDSPLLGDWITEENKEEVEDNGPEDDDGTDDIDPVPESVRKNSHVEGQLAQLDGCEAPDVYQCEGKGYLHYKGQVVRHCIVRQPGLVCTF